MIKSICPKFPTGKPLACSCGQLTAQPDIAFVVSLLSQFFENPDEVNWNAVKRVLKFLKGTKDCKIILRRNYEGLVGYVDANWASQDHRHSFSAHLAPLCTNLFNFLFQIDRGTISWSCQKQTIISLLSTEAELNALTHATKEAVWILLFITQVFQPLNDRKGHSIYENIDKAKYNLYLMQC